MAASALSALLGFGREVIAAHFYGTRPEMDAYVNASTVPTVLFDIFNFTLVGVLVPTFSEYMGQGRPQEVRKLGSTVINALFVLMSALAVLGWFLAPYFVPIVAHGFPPAEQRLVIEMVRWLLPGIIATSISGVCSAMLNANHRFLSSALVWVAANLVTIAIVIALHNELGIFALVLGAVVGLFAQLLVQLPSILRYGLYRFEVDLRHPGLAKSCALLLPIAVGSGAWQINLAFDRYFASTLHAGSTAGLGYSTKITFLPMLIVVGAIGTVIFPVIAGQFASANRTAVRNSITLALRMVSFIVIPSAAGLWVLAYPIVQTLFERGAFGPAATALCTGLIPFACLPLIAFSYNAVLERACYACKKVNQVVGASIVTVIINISLSGTWLPILGARGLLLANGVAGSALVLFQFALLSRSVGGLAWGSFAASISRILAATSAMVGALVWVRSLGFVPDTTVASRVSHLAVLLATGVVVFIGAARALGVKELSIALSSLMQRFKRRAVSVPESAGEAGIIR